MGYVLRSAAVAARRSRLVRIGAPIAGVAAAFGASMLGAGAGTLPGTVTLDKAYYSVDDQPTITVTDSDLNTDSLAVDTAPVTLTSASDGTGIAVTLQESGLDTGVFNLAVPAVSFTTGPSDDGLNTLQVAPGDLVTATYEDGSPIATVTATARMYTDGGVTLGFDKPRYQRSQTATLNVTDAERNTSASSKQTITATLTSETDSTGVSVSLEETGNNTGVFTGTATFNGTLSSPATGSTPPSLQVSAGDDITLTYGEPKFDPSPTPTVSHTASAIMFVDNASAALDKANYQRTETATLTVVDIDADLDVTTAEQVEVTVSSETDTTGVDVVLTETGVNTSTFTGTATFTDGASSGSTLQVASGDDVTLTYNEPRFAGGTGAVTGTATMASNGTIDIEKLRYRVATDNHQAKITVVDADLDTGDTAQTVQVNVSSATDTAGVNLTLTETGADDGTFEGTATFTLSASTPTTLRVSQGDTITALYVDARPLAGGAVNRTDTATAYADTATSSLDKRHYRLADTATLTVDDADRNHDPAVAESVTGNLESTTDTTGTQVTLTETGANTGIFRTTATFNTTATTPATGQTPASLQVAAADTVTLRYSEPRLDGTSANVDGTATMYANTATAALDKDSYQRTETATLTVVDVDRNQDAAVPETVTATLTSDSDGTGVSVTLTETGANTSTFRGTATFTDGTSSGTTLKVASGDTVTVTYAEPQFTAGNQNRTDTAVMATDGTVALDKPRYRLATSNHEAKITVDDPDLDTSGSAQSVQVTLSSTSDTTGITVTLTETGADDGTFEGTATFTSGPSGGAVLKVSQGDTITALYVDTKPLAGTSANRTDTATIYADTATASLDKAHYQRADTATLRVVDADADADATVAESLSVNLESTSDTTGTNVTLTETGPGTGVFQATATFNTTATTPAAPETPASLHVASGDTVTVTYTEPKFDGNQVSRNGTATMFANTATADLDQASYQQGNTANLTVVDVDRNQSATTAEMLTATLTSDADSTGVQITLTEDGVNSSTFKGTATFTNGTSSGSTLKVESGDTVTLAYAEPQFAGGTAARTDTATMATDGTVSLDKSRYRLATSNHEATITVVDADLDTNGGTQTVQVQLTSTADSVGVAVTLTETGADDGTFEGIATFTDGTSSGTTLKVVQGDTVTARYVDGKPLAGTAVNRTATAAVYNDTATASLDKTGYARDEIATLRVVDVDANANPSVAESVTVTFKSGADTTGLTFTMSETAADSGVFTRNATFNETSSTTTSGTPSLKVVQGDALSLSYSEPLFAGADATRLGSAAIHVNGSASLNADRYDLDDTATLTVSDADLNTSNASAQQVTVQFTSASDATGVPVTLTETGNNSGVFRGTATFTSGGSFGTTLHVVPGEKVTLTYAETTTYSGADADRADEATIATNGTAALNATRYRINETATLTVTDTDLNTSDSSMQTVSVKFTSTADATGVNVTLTETAPSSGVFSGTATFNTTGSSGSQVQVAQGDTVTMTYAETTTFEGPAANRTATAAIYADAATVAFDADRYGVADTVTVTVTDVDRNASPAAAEEISAKVTSVTDATGVDVTLTETGNDTGVFTGTVSLTTGASTTAVTVAEGGMLTATYAEPNAADAGNTNRTDTAKINTNGTVDLDKTRYQLTDTPTVTVTDVDLDTAADSPQTVVASLTSTSDTTGVSVTLTETGNNTGVFTGNAALTTGTSTGSTLKVASGDTVTATYAETTTFQGPPVNRTDTGVMATSSAVTLNKRSYQENDTATLSVTDSDRNGNAALAETLNVTFTSTTDTAGITVMLSETGANSGVFTGTATLVTGGSSDALDQLQVVAGDTVTLTDNDPTTFEGPAAGRTATATTYADSATATLDATRYQLDDTATLTVTDADLNSSSASAQTVAVNLKSTSDATGVSVTLTETGNNTGIFSGTATFTAGSSSGTSLKLAQGDTVTLTYGEPTFAGGTANRTDTAGTTVDGSATLDDTTYQRSDTATLTVTDADLNTAAGSAQTVAVNLKSTSDATGVSVTLTETGNNTGIFSGTATFTTGSSSGSALKVAGGDTVTLTYAESTTFAGPAANRTDTAVMRVDGSATLDDTTYQRSDTATLTVTDADLNTAAGSAQTVAVNLKSTSDATGVSVTLTETGNNTGIFSGTATFTTGSSSGSALKVAGGDTVTLTYAESSTFAGPAANRTDTAVMRVNGTAALDQTSYKVSDSATLTVTDADLNTAAGSAQTVAVNLKSTSDTTGVSVTLTETGANTGVFTGTATFRTGASSGTSLKVAVGNTVTLTYAETTTFDGPNADRTDTATITQTTTTTTPPPTPTPTTGYWVASADGTVYAFGGAKHLGDLRQRRPSAAIVALVGTPSHKGYWLAAADGHVYPFGDATSLGSMGGRPLNRPIVGMAATPKGDGYWLVASDGGIFSFGQARFHGSMGGSHLNKPMVGIASTPSGKGYWTVASDGGIFAYGDATFRGSMGDQRLNQPVIGMTAVTRTDQPHGYRLVASDGGIFSFGAPFYGSLGSTRLNQPITGMSTVPSGRGYRMVAADGGVFSFGPDAPAHGSAANQPRTAIVTAMDGF